MKFTQDWFSNSVQNFYAVKNALGKVERILEIGCFEGRATCWMLANMLSDDGVIQVIDTFGGGEEHSDLNLSSLRQTFDENVEEARKETQMVNVLATTSYDGLGRLITRGEHEYYDFIYVDGSHTTPDVLTDACMAFGLLRKGGIMLFDDYMWREMPDLLHRPKTAIDFFTIAFANQCTVCMVGYQLAIQKQV